MDEPTTDGTVYQWSATETRGESAKSSIEDHHQANVLSI